MLDSLVYSWQLWETDPAGIGRLQKTREDEIEVEGCVLVTLIPLIPHCPAVGSKAWGFPCLPAPHIEEKLRTREGTWPKSHNEFEADPGPTPRPGDPSSHSACRRELARRDVPHPPEVPGMQSTTWRALPDYLYHPLASPASPLLLTSEEDGSSSSAVSSGPGHSKCSVHIRRLKTRE